jgi:hypothetical protein
VTTSIHAITFVGIFLTAAQSSKRRQRERLVAMPPKATEEVFLATCIKHAKTKPEIDFAQVAAELGMSAGGVS